MPDESTASRIAEIEKRLLDDAPDDIAFLLKLAHPSPDPDGWIATSERLLRAINWAMGCGPDDFRSVRHDAPRFWWRSELAERAGLEYDGEKYVIRPTPPVREQP